MIKFSDDINGDLELVEEADVHRKKQKKHPMKNNWEDRAAPKIRYQYPDQRVHHFFDVSNFKEEAYRPSKGVDSVQKTSRDGINGIKQQQPY